MQQELQPAFQAAPAQEDPHGEAQGPGHADAGGGLDSGGPPACPYLGGWEGGAGASAVEVSPGRPRKGGGELLAWRWQPGRISDEDQAPGMLAAN